MRNFATQSGKSKGQFYTPAEVSRIIAKVIGTSNAKTKSQTVYDPTCGSGSLLLKAQDESPNGLTIYGQEKDLATTSMARMNMIIHAAPLAEIKNEDTISAPQFKENEKLKTFDFTVANPPFSLDKWGADDANADRYNRFHRGVPPKSKGDYAFVTHMIETLNEHGKAGVVLPHGVLFRGSSEGKIREQLIKENLLKAVIGLPANLFFGTGIPATILVFDKNKGDNTDVLFIDASNEFENAKNQNKLSDANIDKIFTTYKNWETVDKYSYVAKLEEIKENDYNLNIPRYVDTFEEEEPVDIKATQEEIKAIKQQIEAVEQKLEQHLAALGI